MSDRRELTRRDLLAAFLGAPFALAACDARRSASRPPLPPGEIVGASHEAGHWIRDGARVVVPADRWQKSSVVIVGGGISGLAAAWRLEKCGFKDFVLLELEPELGGSSRSGTSSICAYPWGAHYVPLPMKENRAFVSLLSEMDVIESFGVDGEPVAREQLLCRDPEERVFYRGQWYEGLYLRAGASREDLADLAAFQAEVDRWAATRAVDGSRAFTIPSVRSAHDDGALALDRISFGDWMAQNGWRSTRLRWLLDYACRDDYGTRIDSTSAWAGLFYFASRVRSPGLEPQPLLTWPEGNGRFVRHFRAKVGDRIRTGMVVTDVSPEMQEGHSSIRITALRTPSREPMGFEAEQAILCTPRFVAGRIVRDWRESPPAFLRELEYGSWMVANMTLRERPATRGFPLAWDNVLYESPSLGYVTATHQALIDQGPTVLTYYYPLCDDDTRAARTRLLQTTRDEWAEVALSDLERAHPNLRGIVERIDVMRWGHAMPRPKPGLFTNGSLEAARKPFRGIRFAHSDLSGLSLFEEAFHHGVKAAEGVLAERGVRFEPLG